tara:strand:- start:10167 stop:10364 length:198 start_codon:yes stop_codon:yes gene_type:complete
VSNERTDGRRFLDYEFAVYPEGSVVFDYGITVDSFASLPTDIKLGSKFELQTADDGRLMFKLITE